MTTFTFHKTNTTMNISLIESMGMHTQNGTVYVYLNESPTKRNVLYYNGNHWFVKKGGKQIVFKNEKDIEKIKNYYS